MQTSVLAFGRSANKALRPSYPLIGNTAVLFSASSLVIAIEQYINFPNTLSALGFTIGLFASVTGTKIYEMVKKVERGTPFMTLGILNGLMGVATLVGLSPNLMRGELLSSSSLQAATAISAGFIAWGVANVLKAFEIRKNKEYTNPIAKPTTTWSVGDIIATAPFGIVGPAIAFIGLARSFANEDHLLKKSKESTIKQNLVKHTSADRLLAVSYFSAGIEAWNFSKAYSLALIIASVGYACLNPDLNKAIIKSAIRPLQQRKL